MSGIVMVHGAGNDLWGPASIKAKWFPALAEGLAWHGVSVDHSDVSVAFYGTSFAVIPKRVRTSGRRGLDLATVRRVVADLNPSLDLDELIKTLIEHHFDRLLAQAAAYLQEPAVRSAARQRVEAVVGDDTRVVVAHSLGTIVAYEALCAHPDWGVTDFVTIVSVGGHGRPSVAPALSVRREGGVARVGTTMDQHCRCGGSGGRTLPAGPVRRAGDRVPSRQRAPRPRPRAVSQQPDDR
jgi:hypothetical protein